MSSLIRAGVPTLVPEVNWGRWVAKCPRCPSALALGPSQALFECWECGQAAELLWPPAATVYAVERLLTLRPDPVTRNWRTGETLDDLLLENAIHGLLDHLEPGLVLATADQAITTDRLPIATRPLQLAVEVRAT